MASSYTIERTISATGPVGVGCCSSRAAASACFRYARLANDSCSRRCSRCSAASCARSASSLSRVSGGGFGAPGASEGGTAAAAAAATATASLEVGLEAPVRGAISASLRCAWPGDAPRSSPYWSSSSRSSKDHSDAGSVRGCAAACVWSTAALRRAASPATLVGAQSWSAGKPRACSPLGRASCAWGRTLLPLQLPLPVV